MIDIDILIFLVSIFYNSYIFNIYVFFYFLILTFCLVPFKDFLSLFFDFSNNFFLSNYFKSEIINKLIKDYETKFKSFIENASSEELTFSSLLSQVNFNDLILTNIKFIARKIIMSVISLLFYYLLLVFVNNLLSKRIINLATAKKKLLFLLFNSCVIFSYYLVFFKLLKGRNFFYLLFSFNFNYYFYYLLSISSYLLSLFSFFFSFLPPFSTIFSAYLDTYYSWRTFFLSSLTSYVNSYLFLKNSTSFFVLNYLVFFNLFFKQLLVNLFFYIEYYFIYYFNSNDVSHHNYYLILLSYIIQKKKLYDISMVLFSFSNLLLQYYLIRMSKYFTLFPSPDSMTEVNFSDFDSILSFFSKEYSLIFESKDSHVVSNLNNKTNSLINILFCSYYFILFITYSSSVLDFFKYYYNLYYKFPFISSKRMKELNDSHDICPICLSSHNSSSITLPCNHSLHFSCLLNIIHNSSQANNIETFEDITINGIATPTTTDTNNNTFNNNFTQRTRTTRTLPRTNIQVQRPPNGPPGSRRITRSFNCPMCRMKISLDNNGITQENQQNLDNIYRNVTDRNVNLAAVNLNYLNQQRQRPSLYAHYTITNNAINNHNIPTQRNNASNSQSQALDSSSRSTRRMNEFFYSPSSSVTPSSSTDDVNLPASSSSSSSSSTSSSSSSTLINQQQQQEPPFSSYISSSSSSSSPTALPRSNYEADKYIQELFEKEFGEKKSRENKHKAPTKITQRKYKRKYSRLNQEVDSMDLDNENEKDLAKAIEDVKEELKKSEEIEEVTNNLAKIPSKRRKRKQDSMLEEDQKESKKYKRRK